MRPLIFLIITNIFLAGCGNNPKNQTKNELPAQVAEVPVFNEDSAFSFVRKQVEFGPRIPNTPSHAAAATYFINHFENYGANTTIQEFDARTYSGEKLHLKNIIASFNSKKKKRVLLAAHWDTRPFADRDPDNQDAKFDGANDGASGVGVLLEIARTLKSYPPEIGVDLILFDGEDWGEKANSGHVPTPDNLDSWYCLGSQYWGENKHSAGYSAYYGILLDMVGSKGAKFFREEYSQNYAPKVVEKVWNAAETLGYSHIFIKQNYGPIIDDHKYVNELSKIPMIDIVNYDPEIRWFGSFHHTQADNLDIIDKETLKAVGQTILYVLYNEKELKSN